MIVDVGLELGHIHVRDVIWAVDVGRSMNPQRIDGQIDGTTTQGIGYPLKEDFQQASGHGQSQHLSTHLIPTVLDVLVDAEQLGPEEKDPLGPQGAGRMVEMPVSPLTPATVAAVREA